MPALMPLFKFSLRLPLGGGLVNSFIGGTLVLLLYKNGCNRRGELIRMSLAEHESVALHGWSLLAY